MKILQRIALWTGILLLTAFTGITIFLHTVDFSVSDETIRSSFQKTEHKPEYNFVSENGHSVHYVAIGDTSKPIILFVHGSPGSWDNFLDFIANPDLLKNYRMISVDRPGFGKSDAGNPVRSLSLQASLIAHVLRLEKRPAILVGHSYGGPVVIKMAIEHPELVSGIVLVAASVDPELEETKWFQIPVHYKALSWILPDNLYSTNEEILVLKEELQIMEPDWQEITQPVSVIQGEDDNLVPKENADYAEKHLRNASVHMVRVPDLNHFIPWNRPELISKEIEWVFEAI